MNKETSKIKKCTLCEKNCSSSSLACLRGIQRFDETNDLFPLMRRAGHVLYNIQDQNGSQGRILHILSIRNSMSQRELQEILHVQPGSLSEIIGKLEAKGYLKKQRDEEDGRKIILKITPKGRKSPEEISYLKSREALFGALNEKEQEQLKKILKKLLDQWLNTEGKEI